MSFAVGFRAKIDDVLAGIALMGVAANLQAFSKPFKLHQVQHGKDKAGSEGAWAPRGYKRRKGNPRQVLGRLSKPTTWKIMVSRDQLSIRSRAAYSAVHQDGGVVGRGAVIPAREFLYVSREFLEMAADKLGSQIVTRFGR